MSRLDAAHGYDDRLEWGDIPRHNRLQGEGDMAGNQRGINGVFRNGAVTPTPFTSI